MLFKTFTSALILSAGLTAYASNATESRAQEPKTTVKPSTIAHVAQNVLQAAARVQSLETQIQQLRSELSGAAIKTIAALVELAHAIRGTVTETWQALDITFPVGDLAEDLYSVEFTEHVLGNAISVRFDGVLTTIDPDQTLTSSKEHIDEKKDISITIKPTHFPIGQATLADIERTLENGVLRLHIPKIAIRGARTVPKTVRIPKAAPAPEQEQQTREI